MALFLCIETATEVCSVALFRDRLLLSERTSAGPNTHSAILTAYMGETLREAGVVPASLDAVAVSMGPGSYTGLRIGVAAAKGLCYAIGRPLVAVPTLQGMAAGMETEMQNVRCRVPGVKSGLPYLLCPMIDARRMEVYCGVYDAGAAEVREVRAEIIGADSFREFLAQRPVVFGGNGAAKCREALGMDPNALFLDDFRPSARQMAALALERIHAGRFEDLAYFEPFYLKDFVAGKPRVKGLD